MKTIVKSTKPLEKRGPTHVDDWIESRASDDYAAWMLMHFRLPATLKIRFEKFLEGKRLFCSYEGVRYRVTGASRFGDVWLSKDFNAGVGYGLRVAVDECTEWSADANWKAPQ